MLEEYEIMPLAPGQRHFARGSSLENGWRARANQQVGPQAHPSLPSSLRRLSARARKFAGNKSKQHSSVVSTKRGAQASGTSNEALPLSWSQHTIDPIIDTFPAFHRHRLPIWLSSLIWVIFLRAQCHCLHRFQARLRGIAKSSKQYFG